MILFCNKITLNFAAEFSLLFFLFVEQLRIRDAKELGI